MSEIAQRRHEEKELRRNEIINAAEKVAAEVGLDAMTMDQVARCARLSRALSQLPFEQRTVIVLREVDGLSYDEIAEAAGLNVGTVKSRLARARESLRGALRDA